MSDRYHPTVEESLKFATGSSQIEGEYSSDAIRDHLQAWELARGWGLSTSLENILEVHRILQKDLRPDIAGKLRTVPVWVGGELCPPPEMVEAMLKEWLREYRDIHSFAEEVDVAESIKHAHVKFEQIHPFEDGNGRVGRCILNWHRIMNGLPLFIVEPGESQHAYYKWFRK